MKDRVKNLRQNKTDAESRIWYFLRNRRLHGYKFVRENIFGHYIVDFICRDRKLIVEIDGSQHMEAVEYDQRRTDYFASLGYKVVRFWNNEVFNDIQGVLETILSHLEGR